MTIHSRRAGPALQRLAEADPALAALALWCTHRDAEARTVPAWTDGTTIRYAPAFEALALHDQAGVAAHQVLHVAFRHAQRGAALARHTGAAFDADLFNLAADALLNSALIAAGHTLPRPLVTLDELLHRALGERSAPDAALARYDAETLYARLRHAPSGDGGRRDGPGGKTPAEAAAELAAAKGFVADLDTARAEPDEDAGGPDAAEWRARLAQALEAGRRAGRGIGRLGSILADLPEPRTPWETILRGLVTRAVIRAPYRSHRRPARRWLALDAARRAAGGPAPAFEPATVMEAPAPRIALALDCSSSIEGALLSAFLAEIAGIARRTGAELHLIVFDEAVRETRRLDPARLALDPGSLPRGGGTDFAPALAAATALSPSLSVVLTDLDGPLGPRPPGPVLWAVPTAPPHPPVFGRVLPLDR